jgi:hypothetical protein
MSVWANSSFTSLPGWREMIQISTILGERCVDQRCKLIRAHDPCGLIYCSFTTGNRPYAGYTFPW